MSDEGFCTGLEINIPSSTREALAAAAGAAAGTLGDGSSSKSNRSTTGFEAGAGVGALAAAGALLRDVEADKLLAPAGRRVVGREAGVEEREAETSSSSPASYWSKSAAAEEEPPPRPPEVPEPRYRSAQARIK